MLMKGTAERGGGVYRPLTLQDAIILWTFLYFFKKKQVVLFFQIGERGTSRFYHKSNQSRVYHGRLGASMAVILFYL